MAQIIVADSKGRTDGSAHRFLEQVESPLPIVLMARTAGYKFNPELLSLDKYLLIEYSEHGYDWDLRWSHTWGWNTSVFPHFDDEEYKKFSDFVYAKPPVLSFTRELLKKDVTDLHLPIDYPAWYAASQIQSKEEFNNRVVQAFHFWGRSHEARLRLHAEMLAGSSKYGYNISDNPYYFENFMLKEDGRKWLTWWMPWYSRMDMKEILHVNGLSKISIALPGAGVKTFRHVESSVNSVMLKWKDNLAWSFPWDSSNCIECEPGREIATIEEALQDEYLYEVYLEGTANAARYQVPNYAKHISDIIKSKV